VLLLCFLLSLAVSSYIYLFRPRLLLHYRRLLLILGVFVGSVLAYKLMIPGRSVWAGLFPYALAPMIVAALLSPELGLLLAAVMSVFFAYVAGSALEFSQLEILVMSLAARAAEAIGADALLVRVGAYYHDVGKMLRPGYFIENQMYGPNIHDQLTPLASAQAIATHVTEGQNLARRYGIPSRVRDFIP